MVCTRWGGDHLFQKKKKAKRSECEMMDWLGSENKHRVSAINLTWISWGVL